MSGPVVKLPVVGGAIQDIAYEAMMQAVIDRTLRGVGTEGAIAPLPAATTRANRLMVFDSAGDLMTAPVPGAGDSMTGDASLANVTGAGTVARTLADRFGKMPSLLDFSSPAAALANGGLIYVPPGIHTLTAPVTTTDKAVTLIGAGIGVSVLKWSGLTADQNAWTIDNDNFTFPVHIEGLSLETSQTDIGTALRVIFSENDATFARTQQRFTIRDVQIRGDLADEAGIAWQQNGWKRGLWLTNVHRPFIENVYIAGRQTSWSEAGNTTMLFGIRCEEVGTTSAPTDIFLRNVQIYSCAQGFTAAGHQEGIRLERCTFVQCGNAVLGVTEGDIAYPYVEISGCHFNCYQDIITLIDFFDVKITNNLLYKWDFVDTTDKVASKAIGMSGAPRTQISGNTVNNLTKDFTPGSPTQFDFVDVTDTNDLLVSGNILAGITNEVVLRGNSNRCTYNRGAVTDLPTGNNKFLNLGTGGDNTLRDWAEWSGASGGVTIAASLTALFNLDLGTVSVGERIHINAQVIATKDATAAPVSIFVAKESGTASVQFLHTQTSISQTVNALAALTSTVNVSGFMRVTTAGTLVLSLAGACVAGAADVASGGAQIIAHRF